MSALALPPQPSRRLRMVTPLSAHSAPSAPRAEIAGQEALPVRAAGEPHRPHLHLVTGADVPELPAIAAPADLRRRPSAPRSARPCPASDARRAAAPRAAAPPSRVGLAELAGLAPAHPAIRGAQRRAVAQEASRGALASLPAPMRWGAVSMMIVVLLALAAAAGIIGSGLMAPVETSTATVQEGQSLWDVAAATGAPDVSEAMAQIVDLNDLHSSTIHPGQTLVVPVR
ncbi:LysM peptidoglycan-binding domain-containing protein [Actinomyces gaoshouyii]|uniref:LysM domain-containing protein n=1 Tax=Actinomyces gaoshouyii TaxID=1960083 RepID=A0A8H9H9X1_9ACTO|nr:LysM peptidoglycan-binding domain-containing protein [Actinomyces gaoshouyii]GGO99179.1 hypothetical protein GCM10011612_15830 [Actinomyces gaoshouyii]